MIKRALSPQPHRNNTIRSAGFTLLELTIVLFIVTLVLGGLLTPLATRVEQEGRKTTQLMLEDIRASLLGFTVINGHFPCPDCPNNTITPGCVVVNAADSTLIGDGIEDGTDEAVTAMTARGAFGRCATDTGFLPWVTLGVPQNDAWDQQFAYSVDHEFADDDDGATGATCTTATATTSISFCLTSGRDGDMTINDAAAATVAQNIPAIVFSFGANGPRTQSRVNDASISAAELENWWTDAADRTFVADDYIGTTGSEYDDIMLWIATPSLVYRMISAERLP